MLSSILNLFAKSPFNALETHMKKVSSAVHLLEDLFIAIEKEEYTEVERLADTIAELEHQADLTKNEIRNHLPKSLFLPIDRTQLLEILNIQDKIADIAEDIAVLATCKQIRLLPIFREEFKEFLSKNISTFDSTFLITKEMHELLESSFGGTEAEKVCVMIDDVCFKEHEVDLVQKKLLKKLFQIENEMPFTTFYIWQKICVALATISNLSEKLALRIRVTLELK